MEVANKPKMLERTDRRTNKRTESCTPKSPMLKQVRQKGLDQKQPRKGEDIVFPIISQWGLSVAMVTSFYPICPKTLCSLSPTPVMLHIKFDQDWPFI